MIVQFQKYISKNNLIEGISPSLLAVSGGVDSVVMAHLFHESGLPFGIAHCNFRLRGEESDGDEIFVKMLAEKYGVPFFSIQFDTEIFAKKNKMGIQEAARKLRYDWLKEVAENEGFAQIATAHHLDDNIETVLFNFSKGTGIRGMRGILPKRGNIIRPLLFAEKKQIVEYAEKYSLKFREDASNLTDKYSRNHIRHHVVPNLEKVAHGFHANAERTIHNLSEVSELMDFFVEKVREEVLKTEGKHTSIDLKKLLSYPAPRTLLFELLHPFGFNSTHVNDMLQSIENQSGANFHSRDFEATISYFLLKIKRQENFKGVKYLIKNNSSDFQIPTGGRLYLSSLDSKPANFPNEPNTAYFPVEKITWPLTLRHWEKGDYFHPFGMDGHRKKVQDLFTDHKLSRFEKEETWILESGGEICWVVGMRTDERFKVRDWTKGALKVSFTPASV